MTVTRETANNREIDWSCFERNWSTQSRAGFVKVKETFESADLGVKLYQHSSHFLSHLINPPLTVTFCDAIISRNHVHRRGDDDAIKEAG